MIRYGSQSINSRDIEEVTRALRSEFLTTGDLVSQFESSIANQVKAETFVVSSGTAALHSAYFGLGLRQGDEVITPPNTFIATQATAVNLGLRIQFADIDLGTGLISLRDVAEQISNRTRAIVLVDYAGQPCDVDAFRDLIKSREIYLVEDAAHSLGSLYKGKPVGSLADVTTFSFYPTKNITTGEGGAVSSNSPEILDRAKIFARQGMVKNADSFILEPDGPWHQEVHQFGLNYRLTDLQCALGITQLERIDEFKKRRNAHREQYLAELSDHEQIQILVQNSNTNPMWHLFPIQIPAEKRKGVFVDLLNHGIQTQVNYYPAHMHPVFRSMGWSPDDLPNAKTFYSQELSLPMHVDLTENDITFICDTLKEAVTKN
jgi:dTDP-4-amino-4,6-dideoxygalactose transaminase